MSLWKLITTAVTRCCLFDYCTNRNIIPLVYWLTNCTGQWCRTASVVDARLVWPTNENKLGKDFSLYKRISRTCDDTKTHAHCYVVTGWALGLRKASACGHHAIGLSLIAKNNKGICFLKYDKISKQMPIKLCLDEVLMCEMHAHMQIYCTCVWPLV